MCSWSHETGAAWRPGSLACPRPPWARVSRLATGFLGAGIIVQSGVSVRGLTTAASIWCSSSIGILVGTGFYLPAIGLTSLFVMSLAAIPRIEGWLPGRAPIAATLHFRAGYYALDPQGYEKLDAQQRQRELGQLLNMDYPIATGLPFQARVAPPSPKTNGKIKVEFAVDPHAISFEGGADGMSVLMCIGRVGNRIGAPCDVGEQPA